MAYGSSATISYLGTLAAGAMADGSGLKNTSQRNLQKKNSGNVGNNVNSLRFGRQLIANKAQGAGSSIGNKNQTNGSNSNNYNNTMGGQASGYASN